MALIKTRSSSDLTKSVQDLRKLNLFTDIEFICKDGRVRAHRSVISNHSKLIKTTLKSFSGCCLCRSAQEDQKCTTHPTELFTVIMEDFKASLVEKLVSVMYTGKAMLKSASELQEMRNLFETLVVNTIKIPNPEDFSPVKKIGPKSKTSKRPHSESVVQNETSPSPKKAKESHKPFIPTG